MFVFCLFQSDVRQYSEMQIYMTDHENRVPAHNLTLQCEQLNFILVLYTLLCFRQCNYLFIFFSHFIPFHNMFWPHLAIIRGYYLPKLLTVLILIVHICMFFTIYVSLKLHRTKDMELSFSIVSTLTCELFLRSCQL
jgi:hypothetical protein